MVSGGVCRCIPFCLSSPLAIIGVNRLGRRGIRKHGKPGIAVKGDEVVSVFAHQGSGGLPVPSAQPKP